LLLFTFNRKYRLKNLFCFQVEFESEYAHHADPEQATLILPHDFLKKSKTVTKKKIFRSDAKL
jgi:hypothetical protein